MDVLVLAAHPDDEVLGCGGTIAKFSEQGKKVHIAILGEGLTSRLSDRKQADPKEIAELHDCSKKVAALIGAEGISFHNLPDNRFDSVPLLDIIKTVEGLIEEHKPAVVYTQHGGDLNIDHVCLFRATLTATRPMQGHPVKAVYAYEVASSSEWAFQKFEPGFRPNTFQDIASTLDKKIQGMQLYESEARPFPHPRSPEALKNQAARWGAVVGLEAAEAFELIRKVDS